MDYSLRPQLKPEPVAATAPASKGLGTPTSKPAEPLQEDWYTRFTKAFTAAGGTLADAPFTDTNPASLYERSEMSLKDFDELTRRSAEIAALNRMEAGITASLVEPARLKRLEEDESLVPELRPEPEFVDAEDADVPIEPPVDVTEEELEATPVKAEGKGLMSKPSAQTTPTASKESTSFYMDIGEYGETDHGSVPQPTKDAREANLPEEKRTKDIGYGHKIFKGSEEDVSGMIHGIKFKNADGTYRPLSKEEKATILKADMAKHQNMARKAGWDAKLAKLGTSWDELDEPYRDVLTSLAFNVGGAKAGKGWTAVLKAAKDKDIETFAKEIRRKDAGKNTAGMDNRAAKELYYAGLIEGLSEVKDVLPLADHRSGVPK